MVLVNWDGVPTGIRQLRRSAPLEVETVEGLTVPTLAEMTRIKAWLLATRNTLRDYLDLVVLLERLGDGGAAAALASLDAPYPQPRASVTAEVVERLASASPAGSSRGRSRFLQGARHALEPVGALKTRGRHFGELLIRNLLGGATP